MSLSEIKGVEASSESFLMASITSSKEFSIDLIVVLTKDIANWDSVIFFFLKRVDNIKNSF